MNEWLFLAPSVASATLQCAVLGIVGLVVALRVHSVYALYVLTAVVRFVTTLLYAALSLYAIGVMSSGQSVPTTPLYIWGAVGWVDSALTPAVLLAVVAGPVVWQLRASERTPSPNDPQ